MISRHAITKLANEVARRFKPARIGSYAYGRPTPDSGVDLVVMPCKGWPLDAALLARRTDTR